MRDAIVSALADIAARHEVRILFACESGSRAWGFPSPDSDWDVRFVYVHGLDWYLRVSPGKDTISCHLPGDLDVAGWDLRKALGLFARSNVALFEQLGSGIVYADADGFAPRLRALIPEFFNPVAGGNHYYSLARRIRGEHLDGGSVNVKKLFYVLRPLAALQWIAQRASMPPTSLQSVLTGIELDDPHRAWIAELLQLKAGAGESDAVPLDPPVRAWIDGWLAHGASMVASLPHRRPPVGVLDGLFRETLLGRAPGGT